MSDTERVANAFVVIKCNHGKFSKLVSRAQHVQAIGHITARKADQHCRVKVRQNSRFTFDIDEREHGIR